MNNSSRDRTLNASLINKETDKNSSRIKMDINIRILSAQLTVREPKLVYVEWHRNGSSLPSKRKEASPMSSNVPFKGKDATFVISSRLTQN